MKVTIVKSGARPHCIVFPTGLLVNRATAGMLWGVAKLALPIKIPCRLPKELIGELRRARLPPSTPLVEVKDHTGTYIKVEL